MLMRRHAPRPFICDFWLGRYLGFGKAVDASTLSEFRHDTRRLVGHLLPRQGEEPLRFSLGHASTFSAQTVDAVPSRLELGGAKGLHDATRRTGAFADALHAKADYRRQTSQHEFAGPSRKTSTLPAPEFRNVP
jgi:hypothetical protein